MTAGMHTFPTAPSVFDLSCLKMLGPKPRRLGNYQFLIIYRFKLCSIMLLFDQ